MQTAKPKSASLLGLLRSSRMLCNFVLLLHGLQKYQFRGFPVYKWLMPYRTLYCVDLIGRMILSWRKCSYIPDTAFMVTDQALQCQKKVSQVDLHIEQVHSRVRRIKFTLFRSTEEKVS